MNYCKHLAAAGLLLLASPAFAGEFSSTITATSDYDFRGISQTGEDPALQFSLDYAFDSGIYTGLWASNVDFGGDENMEVDAYIGYAIENENGSSWDFGFVHYLYPGTSVDFDYSEIYAKFGYNGFGLETWYSPDYVQSDESSLYFRATYDWELQDDWSLGFHVGYSTGDFFDASPDASYTDYGITLGKTIGNFDLSLAVLDTAISSAYSGLVDDTKVVFTISTTLPWGGE